MMELFSEVFQKQPCTSLSFSQDSTQTENIPANISSETSGLTWRHVKSGRAHCALLIFSFMLLRVVSILCMKRKKLCPKGSYNSLLIFQRLLFFFSRVLKYRKMGKFVYFQEKQTKRICKRKQFAWMPFICTIQEERSRQRVDRKVHCIII